MRLPSDTPWIVTLPTCTSDDDSPEDAPSLGLGGHTRGMPTVRSSERPDLPMPSPMEASPEPGSVEPPTAWMLRSKYRCKMCHKRCFIPCRLSASVFRQMELGTYDGSSPDDDIEWDPC